MTGWRRDLQDAAAFRDDPRSRRRVRRKISADFIRAAEDAIVSARDGVHERRIVADGGVRELELRDYGDLPAMRFNFPVRDKCPRSNPGAIDDEFAFGAHLFQGGEPMIAMDFALGVRENDAAR